MSDLTGELVVDAHQHFWLPQRFVYPWLTPDQEVLYRDYLPEDLHPHLLAAGVDRTVVVQACASVEEASWLLDLAATHPFISGVVGWVDLTSPEIENTLDGLIGRPGFVGVRHQVHDETDEGWVLRPDVLAGLRAVARRDLAYDLLLRPEHLPYVPELADAVPDLRMVVDHLAKPRIATGDIDSWARDMEAVAVIPTIYCKLSGMVTEADVHHWSPADLRPYIQIVQGLFGPERVMFGSDWPVCRLAATYQQVLDALLQASAPLTAENRARLLGHNARAFYRI